MSGWDIALVVGVSVMGTVVAYVRDPERKALVFMLPVPFTLATLSVGRPVDATNVLGMGLLFGFALVVWALHVRCGWPIVAAIAVGVAGYCTVGATVSRLPLEGDTAYWASATLLLVAGLVLVRSLPYREERHYRTSLPVWLKLPAIALTVVGVVAIKGQLGGFATMFPMVGVITAYEARHSLWAIVRRVPWIILVMLPVMSMIRVVQGRLGLYLALALAWPMALLLLFALRGFYMGTMRTGATPGSV